MRDVLIQPPLRLELDWCGSRVRHIDLGWAGACKEEDSIRESRFAGETARFLGAYVRGEPCIVPGIPLAWHRVRGFAGDVLSTLYHCVARGEWISYSGLAGLCGVPGGARAVGGVMSRNPWPLLVPCHRVLRSNGQIGGFSSGVGLKRFLLSLEGVDPDKP
ncbi:MAG: MGMT family protein [Desulfohalobiaceae bacterium]|nr:MGMT family protein [Desulfohalobiaceae bacterium]